MRTLEGGGRESIAEKYMPDAPATQISNPKASSSGDGKQHPDLLVHGAAAKQKDERPAIFLHRGEWRTVWTPTPVFVTVGNGRDLVARAEPENA
jgi:hypothetical protein